MAWYATPDDTYNFTVSAFLEGSLQIWNATLTAESVTYDLVKLGVDYAPTLSIHPGATVSVSVYGKNVGTATDNFMVRLIVAGVAADCPSFQLTVGSVDPTPRIFTFTMPSSNTACKIETFHEQ